MFKWKKISWVNLMLSGGRRKNRLKKNSLRNISYLILFYKFYKFYFPYKVKINKYSKYIEFILMRSKQTLQIKKQMQFYSYLKKKSLIFFFYKKLYLSSNTYNVFSIDNLWYCINSGF